jgi:hypothetical protein
MNGIAVVCGRRNERDFDRWECSDPNRNRLACASWSMMPDLEIFNHGMKTAFKWTCGFILAPSDILVLLPEGLIHNPAHWPEICLRKFLGCSFNLRCWAKTGEFSAQPPRRGNDNRVSVAQCLANGLRFSDRACKPAAGSRLSGRNPMPNSSYVRFARH